MPIDNAGLTADLTAAFGDLSGRTAAEGAQAVANAIDSNHTDGATGTADALGTTGADVDIGAAAPPSAGQVLTAVDATHATWQTPAGGGAADALATSGADVDVGAAAPPSAGQVLTATGATTATWQTPAAAPSPSGTVTAETAYGQASSAGAASTYSRGDHTHGTPSLSSATPAALGSASAGVATTPSRGDHVHAMPSAADVGAYYAGGTDVAVADGGTGASTASDARTNLGLGSIATETATAGGDLAGTWPSPTVTQARGLRETAGPTTLTMGSVSDGQYLKREGSTIIGVTLAIVVGMRPTGGLDIPLTAGDQHVDVGGGGVTAHINASVP